MNRSRPAARAVVLALALVACASDEARDERPLQVGVVFDVGGRGDGGFNDGAAAGAERAQREGGIDVRFSGSAGDGQGDPMRRFAEDGVDLIVAVGFLASHDATLLAREFPAVRFAVIDYALPTDAQGRTMLPPPNLAAIGFREQEGAFLVGALAALSSRSRTVGFVGGMQSPVVERFEAGYEAGVRRVCADCRVIARYAGTTPEAFRAPAIGYALATEEYRQGADVVFHASGGTGAGVFRAARETGRRAIGVDVDQWHEAPGLVLTSMVKRIDVAVYDVMRRTRRGEFTGGVQSYGLEENGVGWVEDARNESLVPADLRARVETLRAAVVARLVEVPSLVR